MQPWRGTNEGICETLAQDMHRMWNDNSTEVWTEVAIIVFRRHTFVEVRYGYICGISLWTRSDLCETPYFSITLHKIGAKTKIKLKQYKIRCCEHNNTRLVSFGSFKTSSKSLNSKLLHWCVLFFFEDKVCTYNL